MWAVGIILFEFISKNAEKYFENIGNYIFKMKSGKYKSLAQFFPYKYHLPVDLEILLLKLLLVNPSKRMNVKDALKTINQSKMVTLKELNEFYEQKCKK